VPSSVSQIELACRPGAACDVGEHDQHRTRTAVTAVAGRDQGIDFRPHGILALQGVAQHFMWLLVVQDLSRWGRAQQGLAHAGDLAVQRVILDAAR
jgi:hypothetical protein